MPVFGPGQLAMSMAIVDIGKIPFKKTFRSRVMFSDKAYKISGVTKDSNGTALGNCIVNLFYTVGNVPAATVESDASGVFSFSIGPALACYIVAYKAGAPDVAGTSVNTLTAT